jgi:hypothetical protein
VNLCVLCGTENKHRSFPYTTLTDWFLGIPYEVTKERLIWKTRPSVRPNEMQLQFRVFMEFGK